MIRGGIEGRKIFNDDTEICREDAYLLELVRYIHLLSYWSVVELGMAMVDLARRFDLTPAAVSCAVHRGEKMAKEKGYQLETGDI